MKPAHKLSRAGNTALIAAAGPIHNELGRSLSGLASGLEDYRRAVEAGRDRYLERYGELSDGLERADRGEPQPGIEADIRTLEAWRDLVRTLERAEAIAGRLSDIHFQGGTD